MLSAFSRVSAFEFSMMYTSKLYFEGWVPCDVCVYGIAAIFLTQLVCRLRARYGVCFQSGRTTIVALESDSLLEWALYMACSSVVVRFLG